MRRLRKRSLHFFGAVIYSAVGICVGVVLVVIGYLATVGIPVGDDNQVVSLFLGIVGSVVASIIYSISDKYIKSCNVFSRILNQVGIFIKSVECILDNDSLNNDKSKFELWCLYNSIREKSCELTYRNDFEGLSEKMDAIIGLLGTDAIDLIKKEKCKLVCIRNKLTE